MGEVCEVCGRERGDLQGWFDALTGPHPAPSTICACGSINIATDVECYRLGYERSQEALAAANARAEKAEVERDHLRAATLNANKQTADLNALRLKQDAELVSTREALAAARRECEGQCEAKDAAYERIYRALDALNADELWSVRVTNAREALAAPAASEEKSNG